MRFSTLIGIFAGSQAFTSGSPVPEPENKPAVLHKRDMCTMRAERNFVPIDGFGYYSEFWLEYVGGHLISKLNMYSDPSAGGGLTIRASDSHLPNDGFWRASGKGSGFDGCSFDFEGQGHRGYTYERDNGWVAGCAVDFGCEGGRGLVGIEASADLVTREIEPVVDAIAEPAILAKRDMCTLRGEVLRFYQRGKGYQYSWSMWLEYVGGHRIATIRSQSDQGFPGFISAGVWRLPNDGQWTTKGGNDESLSGCRLDYEGQGHDGYTYSYGGTNGCAVDFGCEGGIN